MKLSQKHFRVKDDKQLTLVLNKEKIFRRLEKILEKINEDENIILSNDEIEFVKTNIEMCKGEDSYWISRLIKYTRDSKWIKECLDKNEFSFTNHEKMELIISTQDEAYIKGEIEKEDTSIDAMFNRMTLLKSLGSIRNNFEENIVYIQEVIKSREIYLPLREKVNLLISFKNNPAISESEYLKLVISWMKDDGLDLSSIEKGILINSLKDLSIMNEESKKSEHVGLNMYEDFLIEFLSNDEAYALEQYTKYKLISETNNKKFYGFCLRDKGIGLNSNMKTDLIKKYRNFEDMSLKEYMMLVESIVEMDLFNLSPMNKVNLIKDLKNEKELESQVKVFSDGSSVSAYEVFALKMLFNKEYNNSFGSFEKMRLAQTISNVMVIDFYFISDKLGRNVINPKDKADLILSTQDEKYIQHCIENKKLNLGANGRASLINSTQTVEQRKEAIKREGFLKEDDKISIIIGLRDKEYLKQCLTDSEINLSPMSKVRLIISTLDNDFIKKCLEDDSLGLSLKEKDELIKETGDKDKIEKWNQQIITIKNISELSVEELRAMPEITMIKLQDRYYDFYSKDEYLAIREKMDEILDGVEKPTFGDVESELSCFSEVAKRLANHLSYNNFALTSDGKRDWDLQKNCRNLYGGLIEGEAVCAGFADIFGNALACMGFETKYINGDNPSTGTGHAWNQVKIGDKWYNADLTWERDAIVRTGKDPREILKSDKEFEDHNIYSNFRSENEEKCDVSLLEYNREKRNLDKNNNGRIKQREQNNDEQEIE